MRCIQISLSYPDRNVTTVRAMGPDSFLPGSPTKTKTTSMIWGEIFRQVEETITIVRILGQFFLQETTQKVPSAGWQSLAKT